MTLMDAVSPRVVPTDPAQPIHAVIFTRVSRRWQEYERQISNLQRHADRMGWQVIDIIAEKITGVRDNADRAGIGQLLSLCASGMVQKVLITEVSRLGRRPSQTHQILETLTVQRVSIYVGQYNIETLLPTDKLNPAASMIFSITADMARQERETLSERISSGMAEPKRRGQRFGRQTGRFYSDDDLRKKYAKPLRELKQGLSIRKVAKLYDLSTDTVQRIKKLLTKPGPVAPSTEVMPPPEATVRVLPVSLYLGVENNSKFVRGKTEVRKEIEDWILSQYGMQKPDPQGWEYTLQIPYESDEEIDTIADDILRESMSLANGRHCFIEWDSRTLDGSDFAWKTHASLQVDLCSILGFFNHLRLSPRPNHFFGKSRTINFK